MKPWIRNRYARFYGNDPLRDVDDEIAFHFAQREQDLQRLGYSAQDARAEAMRGFGDRGTIERELKQIGRRRIKRERRAAMLTNIIFDMKHALRSFLHRPLVPALVVLMLATAIGSGTAVYSLFESVVLHPVPVRNPDQLVAFTERAATEENGLGISLPMLKGLRARSHTLAGLAGHSDMNMTLQDGDHAEQVMGSLVSGNFFSLLGVLPQRGRVLGPADEAAPGSTPNVVISSTLWHRMFGSDDVVGKTVRINGKPFSIVGVASSRFRGTDIVTPVDLWLPITMTQTIGNSGLYASPNVLDTWSFSWIEPIGRLAPNTTIARANAEMRVLFANLDAAKPVPPGPAFNVGKRKVRVFSGRALNEYAAVRDRASLLRFLLVLAGVIGTCLAIACVNVANLMMMRTVERTREIAMRLAMGARPARLVSQLLVEHLTLGVLAGILGIAIALGGMRALGQFSLPGGIDISELALGMNMRVLAFTSALSIACAVAFGLVPAIAGTRAAVFDTLQQLRHGSGRSRFRGGSVLVAVQVALSLVLVVAGFLFIRSLRTALRVDPGFQTAGIATVSIGLEQSGYRRDDVASILARFQEAAAARPALKNFAFATETPVSAASGGWPFSTTGGPVQQVGMNIVSGSYFGTLGIQLVAGRVFDATDIASAQPVSIVTESAARKLWPGADPIGKEVQPMPPIGPVTRVIGVVRDGNFTTLEEREPFVFLPVTQMIALGGMQRLQLVGREADAGAALRDLHAIVHDVNPSIAPFHERRLQSQLDAALMPQRFGSLILGVFGVLSLLISAVGIYAVAAYDVTRRKREIGIRAALGADRDVLVSTVLRRSGVAICAGSVIGLMIAFEGAHAVRTFLFGIRPDEWPSYLLAAVTLGAVATLASWIPARRAARSDPMGIMRES